MNSKLLNVFKISLGAIIFPLAILLPFTVHASQMWAVLGLSGSDTHVYGSLANCSSSGGIPHMVNQCVQYGPPSGLNLAAFIAFAVVLAWSLVSIYIIGRGRRNERKNATIAYAIIAILSAIATWIAYAALRTHSQQAVFSADTSPNGQTYVTNPSTLGYGLSPFSMVEISIVYLIMPIFILYRNLLSPRRIGGVKKKELFQ